MADEASAGLSAIKTAFDLARGLKDIDDPARRNAAVMDLQEKILSAQAAQSGLVERVRELESQVKAFEDWDAEKKRYQMRDVGGGTFVYDLKPDMAQGEPPHRLCPACYQNRKKGILQSRGRNAFQQEMVVCSECAKQFNLGQQVVRTVAADARDIDVDPFTGR
jgi:hypothetical protein